MALANKKITDSVLRTGVISAPDKLTGTAAENKMVFDRLIRNIVAQSLNPLIDELAGENGAAAIGFSGGNLGMFTAETKNHIVSKDNPHGISVKQIGAETPEGAQNKVNEALLSHQKDVKAHASILSAIVQEAVNLHTSQQYRGTLLVTIPVSLWHQAQDDVPGFPYICDVPAKVNDTDSPNGACLPGFYDIAGTAGMASGCQTFNGFLRFFAKRIPTAEIQAWVALYRAWDGSSQAAGIPLGKGLEINPQGALELDGSVATQEDFADEEEVSHAVGQIFQEPDPLTIHL